MHGDADGQEWGEGVPKIIVKTTRPDLDRVFSRATKKAGMAASLEPWPGGQDIVPSSSKAVWAASMNASTAISSFCKRSLAC